MFLVHVVERVDQRIVLILSEIFLDDFDRLLIDLVVLMCLQVLEVIQAVFRLHHYRESVLTLLILEVLITTLQNIINTLQGNSEHFHILELEN